jgi:hypothetical protein
VPLFCPILDFSPFFAPFLKIEKGAKNGRKVKALALRFSQFLPVFRKSKEEAKNERIVKALALLFCQFYHRDYGENGTVINGQAMN